MVTARVTLALSSRTESQVGTNGRDVQTSFVTTGLFHFALLFNTVWAVRRPDPVIRHQRFAFA